ncbi:MAG: 4-hydroxy-3-methylbut-2-enyl diphosphate reductase [Duodenibacillus sp.]|nr:4-hydroxy-3-methylbut-2-enyl diphosphate reductase [Duodenibacillus sp.]
MQVILAQPRGFCAGVTRAIKIVERALAVHGAPIYVRHEIVHNKTVVAELQRRGAIFIENIEEVPDGATLIFSAHGIPRSEEARARSRNLTIYDATCPLVKKVHREVIRMHEAGKKILMIGHIGHPEVEGTMGQIDSGIRVVQTVRDVRALPDLPGTDCAYVSQTTVSVDDAREVIDALREKFPGISEPKKSDVCYATQNRQDAVKALARAVDLILVIGSVTSSNTNRLREVSERQGVHARLIDSAQNIDPSWFDGIEAVGITAGASAPETLVSGVVQYLRDHFEVTAVTELGHKEDRVAFPMPKGLWDSDLQTQDHEQSIKA